MERSKVEWTENKEDLKGLAKARAHLPPRGLYTPRNKEIDKLPNKLNLTPFFHPVPPWGELSLFHMLAQ